MELEKTSYERLLNIEVFYESKDRKINKLKKQNGVTVKINEKFENRQLSSITIEALSPKDMFFHFFTTIDMSEFLSIRNSQKLKVDFPEYVTYLIKNFNNIQKKDKKTTATAVINIHGNLIVEIRQKMGMKKIMMFKKEFSVLDYRVIRKKINSSYKTLDEKTRNLEDNLLDILEVVKLRSPGIYRDLQKAGLVK